MTEVWVERTEKLIRVRGSIEVSADAAFAILADPRRHAEIDGSGMVQAAADAVPITSSGQVFTMEMFRTDLGEYRTDNHVLDFADGHRIAWTTGRAGQPPAGVRWGWDLDPIDATHTTVTHTYDWTNVTDPAVLARVEFPRVQPDELAASVRALEAAAR